ncbi:MAG: DUF2933 domain-containing protein [Bdellovibrionales bacterium]
MNAEPTTGRWTRRLAIAGALGVILFYLLTEHRAHFFGALPYLLLLACPLMHFFMHGGHGGHNHSGKDRP